MNDQSTTVARRTSWAATCVGDRSAILAVTTPDGPITSEEIVAGPDQAAFLALIVHRLGLRDRIFVAGPEGLRAALERCYVSVYRRPDVFVDFHGGPQETAHTLGARLRLAVEGRAGATQQTCRSAHEQVA